MMPEGTAGWPRMACGFMLAVAWVTTIPGVRAGNNPWFDLHSGQMVTSGDSGSSPPGGDPPPPDCESCTCEGGGGESGDPVFASSGQFSISMVDLRVPGPIPLELRRTYHTKYLYNGPLGFGWDFEYNQRLYRLSNTNLVLRRGHADSEEFTHDGGGGFSGPPGTGEAIQENLDGSYSLLRPDGMQFVYAFDGSLTRVEDVRGNQLLFSYDPAGKLPIQGLSNFSVSTNPVVVARDFRLVRIDEARNDVPSGRYLDFLYNDNGRVTNAMCHTGADVPDLEVSYSYDTNDTGNLVMYTDVEGLTFPYAYDDMHRLTNFFSGGCTCLPRSQQFDSEGRVIQQTIGNTVIDFEYLISGVRTRVTTHIVDDETLMFLRDRIEVFDFTPEGQVSQHRLQMGSQQDPGGGESDDLVTQYTYDSATEEILEKVNPDGAIEAFTYDFADRSLTREIRSSSETLTRHAAYDGLGNVTNEFMTWTGNPGIRFGDRAGAFDNEGRILTDTRIGTNGAQLVTSYSYGTNGTHEVVTITDPEGNRRRQEFDVRGNLVRDYDPDFPSIQTLYGYDSRGNRTNRIDALGFETRWEYDAKGRVTRETNPLLHESVFTYSDGNLIREERGIHGATPGRVLVHEYNASNHRVATHRVDDFGGTNLWMRWGYDSSGRVTYRENATGQRTKYVYDAANRRVSAENIYGGVTSNEFDKAGRVAMRIDAVGVTTRLQYDLAGLRTQRVEAVGTAMERTRSVRSDFPGRVTERIHPDGSITRYDYDAFGRLARIHGDREYGESLFYDGNGRLIAEIDGRGLATTNRYDEQGRLVEIVNPDATTQGIGYDLLGRMVSTTNENTNSTYMTYDALGRLLTRSAPNDSNAVLFAYTYSPWGDVTSVSNAAGGQEHATFDFAGRKVLTIDTAGLILSNTYDALDNRVLITWPNGTTISNTYQGKRFAGAKDRAGYERQIGYDPLGRKSFEVMSGVTNFYHFDELDRLVAVSNSLGTSVQHEYDVLDQVTRTIFADQRSLTRAYDNFGNITNRQGVGHPEFVFHFDEIGSLTQKVDGVGRTTELEYDERNRLRRKTYADGTYVEYTYDGVGNVLTRRDPIGRLTSYSYDAGNLTVMVDYENDATIAANYDVLGRLTRLGSQSGTNEWIYDVSGNVVTNIQGRVQAQVVYGYDSEGNRTVMDFDGVRTDYTYDLAGRLESISNNVGLITYVWKSDAKVVDEIQYPGGVSVSNDYDSLLRLMSRHALNPTGGVAASVVYELDDGGLRTNAAFADGRSVSFSYDELRQITNVTGRLAGGGMDTNYLFSYSYDPAGNFTRSIGNQLQTDFAVNLLNQYTQTVENQGAVLTNLFMYDVGGNLLDDGRNQYEWDEENRLLAVSNGVHRMEFVYNASGFRVESRTFLGAAQQDLRRFVYDGALPIAEVDESNQVLNRYTYGLDLAFALNGAEAPALRPANAGGIGSLLAGTDAVSTNLQFYFYDGNGNVIGLVDEHGVVAASYEYDPFGVALSASGPAAESNPYRFSSKYLEGTYGLAYYGHRYYAPSLGRWLNRDPAEELSAMPTYAFVANNPVNSIDWFGLFDWTTIVSKKADTFSAGDDFPGVFGQAVASIPAGAFGVTVPELSVQAECCECTLVGWQLCDDGFTIIYTIETWFNSNFDAPLSGLFPDFTPEVFEWAQRAEDDHVKDLKRWEKEGRKVAKEIEEMLVDEGEWFLFEEDCREKAEDKLKKVLGPSLIAARSKSVKKWDDFTKNPNHFFSSPWRRP